MNYFRRCDLGRILKKKMVVVCLDDVWRLEDVKGLFLNHFNKQSIVSSITIAKYWDVYSPPPKDLTNAKFGNAFTFLNGIGRQRCAGLESHQIKFASTVVNGDKYAERKMMSPTSSK